MYAQKVFASLALNAALALVVVGMVVYKTNGQTNLGSVMSRSVNRMGAMRSIRSQHQMRNRDMRVQVDMMRSRVAEEYGLSLLEAAEANKVVGDVQKELGLWRDILATDAQIAAFLNDPVANVDEKRGIVLEVSEKAKMSKFTTNFLKVLLDMNRFDELVGCADVFDEEIAKGKGVQEISLKTAYPLDESQQKTLASTLAGYLGASSINLKQSLEPDLLQGFIIEMPDRAIDLSLKHELEMLKQELLSGEGSSDDSVSVPTSGSNSDDALLSAANKIKASMPNLMVPADFAKAKVNFNTLVASQPEILDNVKGAYFLGETIQMLEQTSPDASVSQSALDASLSKLRKLKEKYDAEAAAEAAAAQPSA